MPRTIGLHLEVALEEHPPSRDPNDFEPRPAQALEQFLGGTVLGSTVIGQFKAVFRAITAPFYPHNRGLVDFLPLFAQPALGDVEMPTPNAITFPSPKDVENAVALARANDQMLDVLKLEPTSKIGTFSFLFQTAMMVGELGKITLVGSGKAKPKDTVATLMPVR